MKDTLCRRYDRELRRIDPRLHMTVEASAKDVTKPTYWVRFHLSDTKDLRMSTLEALGGIYRSAGAWIRAAMEETDWKASIMRAKEAFSMEERRYLQALQLRDAKRVPFTSV